MKFVNLILDFNFWKKWYINIFGIFLTGEIIDDEIGDEISDKDFVMHDEIPEKEGSSGTVREEEFVINDAIPEKEVSTYSESNFEHPITLTASKIVNVTFEEVYAAGGSKKYVLEHMSRDNSAPCNKVRVLDTESNSYVEGTILNVTGDVSLQISGNYLCSFSWI